MTTYDYIKHDIANARELASKKNFRWNLRDISIEGDTASAARPTITAHLDILGTPHTTASMTELAVDLQNRLSGSTPAPTLEIFKVIFNDPCTIVLWSDKTKTIVRCQEGDVFDPEKGLAMAIVKKMNGNTGKYCDIFKKWVPEEKEEPVVIEIKAKTSPLTKAVDDFQQRIYNAVGVASKFLSDEMKGE